MIFSSKLTWLITLLCIFLSGCGSPESPESLLRKGKERAAAGDQEEAIRILRLIPKEAKEWPDARLQLGRFSALRQRESEAIEYLNEVPQDGSKSALAAATYLAEIHMKACRLSLAAAAYRQVLQNSPEDNNVRALLATLLVIAGQRREASELLMELLEQNNINLKDTVLLAQPERRPPETEHLFACPVNGQPDPWTLHARAVVDIEAGRRDDATSKLKDSVVQAPEFAAAQALLGELQLDDSEEAFRQWIEAVPKSVYSDPDICYVMGMWYLRQNDTSKAARCFWETVKQDPLHRRAIFQLGQSIAQTHSESSQRLLLYAKRMEDFSRTMERVLNASGKDNSGFTLMIEILAEQGRLREAHNWLRLDNNRHGSLVLSEQTQRLLSSFKPDDSGRIQQGMEPAAFVDLANLPMPDFRELSGVSSGQQQQSGDSISFLDEAESTGLAFSYFSGHEGNANSIRVFESTGGGTGIIDFDMDGLADIVMTQGERWPLRAKAPVPSELHDCLFHQRGGRFTDVSELAGLTDDGYGQGVSVGDYNNDGFPDLYLANIGRNRLLLNNGDGTFSDTSNEAGLVETAWTSSCLILDLNADGNPDLFDVNYLAGDDVLHVECGDNRCSVNNFAGAPDSVLISEGEGRFRTLPGACPTTTPKGLGIVGMYSNAGSPPSLFIANDQVPNFYLRWNNDRYEDEALIRGIAVNYLGRPTACMGVASGDVNNDGQTDLFVTNFEGEANCLYLQTQPGFFSDSIQGSGLMQAGIPLVGWGTQFLDADNDSDLDLAVANGHVGDFQDGGYYRMPLQVFQNVGETRFAEVEPQVAGSIFSRKDLWRSLAVVDWNRDGKQDFVVSAVDAPAALVTNRTVTDSSWIRLTLNGQPSARDASGAKVEFITERGRYWRQVSSGDGFQCSNERVVHFGLPPGDVVKLIRVEWPSGTITELFPPELNCHHLLKEGQSRLWKLPE
ncbi:MAG: FG-GAP-like repeat-containing protein [Planctomycetaceae bacterium]